MGTRTLTVEGIQLEPLRGVLVFDKDSLSKTISANFRIWGQITLTFRYGREDEEVLGLRFCNEAILALKQLWPPLGRDPEFPDDEDDDENLTPLQVTFISVELSVSLHLDVVYSVGTPCKCAILTCSTVHGCHIQQKFALYDFP